MAMPNYAGSLTGAVSGATLAAPRAVNPSCFGTIEGAMQESMQARARIEVLVDRLCGTQPEASGGQPVSDPNGLFDVASRQAMEIIGNMQRLNAALDRLESNLP